MQQEAEVIVKADVWEWERRGLKAWPALSSVAFGGWVFRLGNGYTKRANSANAVGANQPPAAGCAQHVDFRDVMSEAERFYGTSGQPTIFRLTPLADANADALLAAAGYEFLDPSITMTASSELDRRVTNVRIDSEAGPGWLDGIASVLKLAPRHRPIHDQIVKSIRSPKGFATVYSDRDVAGFGLAAVELGAVGLFDILVRPEYRGRGLGRDLLTALMEWGNQQGADAVYLQVSDANHAAIGLYESLGFRAAYAYHYRRRAL